MNSPDYPDYLQCCLTIAGSDPSGGAGLQADLRVFANLKLWGLSVVSLITVQNTQGVEQVQPLEPHLIEAQLLTLLADITPAAAKCGALGSPEIIEILVRCLRKTTFPLVVDPVMLSSNGQDLLITGALRATDAAARECLLKLLPQALVITPNLFEAGVLAETVVTDVESMQHAAQRIALLGVPHVLVKGGHLEGEAVDVLFSGGECCVLQGVRETSNEIHGTGCVLSAAITARLARGDSVPNAVVFAKNYVSQAIRTRVKPGKGSAVLL